MKLKQSETIFVERGKINFAPYNQRDKDAKVIEKLKENFKRVGFLGGISWNPLTGNLIGGHKRLETLDLIYNYDGTKEKEYSVKVEAIELDEKTEKEQNIFLNTRNEQGKDDYEAMARLIPEIDWQNAGITEFDIDIIQSVVPDFEFGFNDNLKQVEKDIDILAKEKIKQLKKSIKQDKSIGQIPTHFTITFRTYEEKAEYLESLGINGDELFITSEKFLTLI